MGYVRLLRSRNVALLASAQTLSVLGDRLYALAVMWLVWQATGSAALMGLVAVVESVPYVVVGSCGGRLLGRFASLRALAWVDAARAVVVGSLPLLWGEGSVDVAALLTVAAVLGLFGAVFDPNLGALVPELVAAEDVQQVTGLLDMSARIARIAGPGSAGLLLLVVPEVHLYTIDAVSFMVSAAALGLLARGAAPAHRAAWRERRKPLPRAWPLLRAHPQVLLAIGVHGAGLFFAATSAIGLPVLLATRLQVGAGAYGLVMAAAGVGALAGNVAAGHLRVLMRFPYVYCAAWAVSGLVVAATGLAATLPLVLALASVGGACAPLAGVALSMHLGARFVGTDRLRLIATDLTVIRAAGLTGMVVVPPFVTAAPAAAFLAGGMSTAAAALLGLVASVRLARRPPPILDPAGGAAAAAPALVGTQPARR